MRDQKRKIIGLTILAIVVVNACNFPTAASTPTAGVDHVATAAAATVEAQQTNFPAQPTNTQPSEASASATPGPTNTSAPLPTATDRPVPCDWAQFVRDVTVPDNTLFAPGATFTKTWLLRNVGTCAWTTDYDLVFEDGDSMDADASVPLPERVDPGESVEISVDLTAPDDEGDYRGFWRLRSANGNRFGIGADAQTTFWVDIKVVDPGDFAYNFALNYCSADWESDTESDLPCPGSDDDEDGFVQLLDGATLEGDYDEDELVLWTTPNEDDDGYIQGEFPPFRVKDGDHFLAWVGCLNDYDRCDVTFELGYRIDGGSYEVLDSWEEEYDDDFQRANVDLSALKDEDVEFVLTVYTNGSPREDAAFWLMPVIDR